MGGVVSHARTRRRKLYSRDYFTHAVLPNCKELINDIEVSIQDAEKIFSAFFSMDTNGNKYISNVESSQNISCVMSLSISSLVDVLLRM